MSTTLYARLVRSNLTTMAQWLIPPILLHLWLGTIIVNGGEIKEPLSDSFRQRELFEDTDDIPRVRITPEEYVKIDGEGPKMTKMELINKLRQKIGPGYEKNERYLALRRNINMLFGNYVSELKRKLIECIDRRVDDQSQ